MIFWQDGVTTYGRDAIMATARQSFALPGWTWTYQIESETVHGCQSGIAVATSVVAFPAQNIERHFAFTMYLVRENGKWTVAADNVHRVS
jgi:SnoaL-like domain